MSPVVLVAGYDWGLGGRKGQTSTKGAKGEVSVPLGAKKRGKGRMLAHVSPGGRWGSPVVPLAGYDWGLGGRMGQTSTTGAKGEVSVPLGSNCDVRHL